MGAPVAAETVLDHIGRDADVIVPMANGEAVGLLDVLEAHHTSLDGVRVHQMHALHPRPSIEGECGDHLRHVSYSLSAVTRPAYWAGRCDLVPNHFSEVAIGAIPNAVLASLRDHRDLGIHRAAVRRDRRSRRPGDPHGTRKTLRPNKIVTTFALGTAGL
jgi:acyl-CoA hydrolase